MPMGKETSLHSARSAAREQTQSGVSHSCSGTPPTPHAPRPCLCSPPPFSLTRLPCARLESLPSLFREPSSSWVTPIPLSHPEPMGLAQHLVWEHSLGAQGQQEHCARSGRRACTAASSSPCQVRPLQSPTPRGAPSEHGFVTVAFENRQFTQTLWSSLLPSSVTPKASLHQKQPGGRRGAQSGRFPNG